MLEKDIENLIAKYPDEFFPGENFRLIRQQYPIEGKRIDILFEDKLKRKIIIEVKRGILNREASGQIAEYYGLLKSKNKNEYFELVLCANVIPKERKMFLENIGIECKELGISLITKLAEKYNYTFIDDREKSITSINKNVFDAINTDNTNNSVWIFQGNPQRYDILNALSDIKIGNTIHWLINQHKNNIAKGHIGLIWMSGKDAGIYAITRIETSPKLLEENTEERIYWIDSSEKKIALRVKMTIIKRLINKPILKKQLLKINGLKDLSILRYFQGTNFPVLDNEWKIISELF